MGFFMDKKLKTKEMESVSGGELPPFVSELNYDKSLNRFHSYKKELKEIKFGIKIAKNQTEKKYCSKIIKKHKK